MLKKGLNITAACVLLGSASLIGQVYAVRELMSALAGSELSLGLTLGLWLLFTGLSAWAGSKAAGLPGDKRFAFALALSGMGLMLPVSVLLPRIMPAMMGYEAGELISAPGVLALVSATVLMVAPLAGLAFPLAAAVSGGAAVYSLEALGSFGAGALFTFYLSSHLGPLQGALVVSAVCLALAGGLPSGRRPFKIAAGILVFSALFLLFWAQKIELFSYNFAHGPGRVVGAVNSKHGLITVRELPGQTSFFTGGEYAFSIPDRDAAEKKAHMPMIMHRDPKEVLLVGGGGAGVVSEMLKHRPARLDYAELDPMVIRTAEPYLSEADRAALQDPRVKVRFVDGRAFIKGRAGRYDLVITSLPEPKTAMVNRYYTEEFFLEVRRILKSGGILSISLPSSPNYISRKHQAINGSIYKTLKAVFPYVRVTPEDTNYYFASSDPSAITFDAAVLAGRFVERGVVSRGFNQYTIAFALEPGMTRYVEGRLEGAGDLPVNRDLRPVSYLYSIALWGDMAGLDIPVLGAGAPGRRIQALLLAALAGLLLLAFGAARGRPAGGVSMVIATTGFAGMAIEVSAVLAFQAFYGYVYEMIGALIALFMLGLYAGSRLSARYAAGHVAGPLRAIGLCEAGMAAVAAMLFAVSLRPDAALPAVSLPLVILLAGGLTGAEFPLALASGASPPGRLYGLDLIGSCLGALLCGLVLIPLLGVAFTAVFVLTSKTVPAAFFCRARRQRG